MSEPQSALLESGNNGPCRADAQPESGNRKCSGPQRGEGAR